jgi:signal transduction histidine kinase
VRLEHLDGQLIITVSDDGIGFDVDATRTRMRTEGGFGLFSLSERLSHANGSLCVTSSPGSGSTAVIRAPIS